MADKINYDFDEVENSPGVITEQFPGLQIMECCGNCKHFFYARQKERRGYCRRNGSKGPKGVHNKVMAEYAEEHWPKVHVTTKCDEHKIRNPYFSLGLVATWMGKAFGIDKLPLE
jgi:hypothetical protein